MKTVRDQMQLLQNRKLPLKDLKNEIINYINSLRGAGGNKGMDFDT